MLQRTSNTKELKLTGCKEGEFTCNDGQCIKMEERCNQVPDCRDKSEENGCQLIVFENNYNKNVPPSRRCCDSCQCEHLDRPDEGGGDRGEGPRHPPAV